VLEARVGAGDRAGVLQETGFVVQGEDQAVDLLQGTVVACIGPVTAEAAQQLGIATNVMPERFTIADLVDALVEHFQSPVTPVTQ
jgi:uroporphyrinogen-III synthase